MAVNIDDRAGSSSDVSVEGAGTTNSEIVVGDASLDDNEIITVDPIASSEKVYELEQSAKASADAAAISEANASTSEANAATSETLAYKWATNPEDVEVQAGEYSARHWAIKAQAIADTVGDFSTITVPSGSKIGTPSDIDTLDEIYNHMYSSGVMNGGDLTDNLDGTIDVAECQATLRATGDDGHGVIYSVVVPASTGLVMTDNALTLVVAKYNAGVPTFDVTNDPIDVNMIDVVPLYYVVREGLDLRYIDIREQNVDSLAKNQKKAFYTEKFVRKDGGAVVSDAGTLHLASTAGAFYFQLNDYAIYALDTTGADVFEYYKHVAGVWTETNASVIDNANYDNGTDLVALGTNKYACHWIYAVLGSSPHYAVVYGTQEHNNVASAETEGAPADVPVSVESLGVLLGRAIVQQGATELYSVNSVWTETFSSAVATDHNELAGLQGGTATEYYHLTNAELTKLTGIEDGATADQTKADIDALGIDADTLDGLDSTQFLRSDADNTSATIGGILLEDSTDRSGLLEVNLKGTSAYAGIQAKYSGTALLSVLVNETTMGLYDDANEDWILNYTENGSTVFYYDGASKLATLSGGIQVTGDISVSGTVDGVDVSTIPTLYAPLASPALTGTPTAPTAVAGTNTTQVATTEFVLANAGSQSATLLTSADNLNNITTEGFYSWVSTSVPTNAPMSFGIMQVINDGARDNQIVWGGSDTQIGYVYTRRNNSGTYTIWRSSSGYSSMGVNGYYKFSDGMILQWGTSGSVPSNGSLTVTLPISFPTACRNASATTTLTTGTDVPMTVGAKSSTSITLYNTSGAAAYNVEAAQPAYWMAIGY